MGKQPGLSPAHVNPLRLVHHAVLLCAGPLQHAAINEIMKAARPPRRALGGGLCVRRPPSQAVLLTQLRIALQPSAEGALPASGMQLAGGTARGRVEPGALQALLLVGLVACASAARLPYGESGPARSGGGRGRGGRALAAAAAPQRPPQRPSTRAPAVCTRRLHPPAVCTPQHAPAHRLHPPCACTHCPCPPLPPPPPPAPPAPSGAAL